MKLLKRTIVMSLHPRAGTNTLPEDLINIPSLVSDYFFNRA